MRQPLRLMASPRLRTVCLSDPNNVVANNVVANNAVSNNSVPPPASCDAGDSGDKGGVQI